ncbi:hypothetical protein EV361DRAFT_425425 [Lentinula raphanica]|nr:hypothetical protein F5880DRAFT_1504419 [Lentinula raphanica]KAJ3975835.1 hypothetical protein EV361DRAFT_425425 [Lentinula raphanica]
MTMFFLWAWGYIHLMLILLTSVHAAPLVTSIDDPPRDLVARQVHNQDSVFYNGERVYGPFKGYIWFNGEREPSHEYGVPSRQVRGQSEYQSLRVSETIRQTLSTHGFGRFQTSITFLQPWPTRFDGGVPYGRLQIYGFNSNDAEVHAGPPIVISFE